MRIECSDLNFHFGRTALTGLARFAVFGVLAVVTAASGPMVNAQAPPPAQAPAPPNPAPAQTPAPAQNIPAPGSLQTSIPPAQSAITTQSVGAQDIVGTWQGTLHAGHDLRTVLKIVKADAGYKATFYSIDQGGQPVSVTRTAFADGVLTYSIDPINGKFEGKISADGKTIAGSWTQSGNELVLNLERANPDTAWPIPEPPKPMAADANPKFDVVTIKPSDPNRPGELFTIRGRHVMTINTSVNDLIKFGYSIQSKQIANAPAWFDEKFDIDGVPDVEGQPNIQQMRILVRDALVERFRLTSHNDQRELSVYALTLAGGGPKNMTITADKPSSPGNFIFRGPGKLMVTNATMKDFCHGMQETVMDKPVVDQTGLTDRYDFALNWTPDPSQFPGRGTPPPANDDPNAPPGLYTAITEQLGLKLESTKANVDVMVIDHVENPSPN